MINSLPWLRCTLLKHLDDPEKIRSLTESTGIDPKKIGWENAVVAIWHEVLRECEKNQRIPLLLENVLAIDSEDEKITGLKAKIKFQNKVEQAMANLPIDYRKMGILDTINCGRLVESGDFWKTGDLKAGASRFLTGIVLGPHQQNPRSLAERLCLEFLGELHTEEHAVYFNGDGITGRMQPLMIESNTEVLLHNKIDEYLESIVDGRELKNYNVIAHLVEVDVETTKDVLYRVFDIVYQKLAAFAKEKEIASLLLMVYPHPSHLDIDQLNQHLKSKTGVINGIKYYRLTTGVTRQEIINWFNANATARVEDIEDYLDPFLEFLLEEDSQKVFKEKQVLPMHVMEKIQDQVFKSVMDEHLDPNLQM